MFIAFCEIEEGHVMVRCSGVCYMPVHFGQLLRCPHKCIADDTTVPGTLLNRVVSIAESPLTFLTLKALPRQWVALETANPVIAIESASM